MGYLLTSIRQSLTWTGTSSTSRKINLLRTQVNLYFGNLWIRTFQKRYLSLLLTGSEFKFSEGIPETRSLT